jgi:putative DNA primase/helicase
VVRSATEQYFTEQDVVARWIDDCCETGKNMSARGQDLFDSWKSYAMSNGDHVGTSKWFSKQLERLGCTKVRNSHGVSGRGFVGIRLRVNSALSMS